MEDRPHHVAEKEIAAAVRKIEKGHLLFIPKGGRRLWNKEKLDAMGQVFLGCIPIDGGIHIRKVPDRLLGYRHTMRRRHQIPDKS